MNRRIDRMKVITYEEWLKNPTPRMMWVWDVNEKDKVRRKVVYVVKGGPRNYPVRATTDDDTDYEAYRHCAEIEEPKTRRMTNKELSRWLREKPTREYKRFKSDEALISYYHNYIERTANEEIEDSVLIREDDGDWKEPLVEV